MEAETIKKSVKDRYALTATQGGCCGSVPCCPEGDGLIPLEEVSAAEQVIREADLGLGCGFPTTHANLQPGETVLDLGSGAGVDVFTAAREVGPQGAVIGIDMTPEMLDRARRNALKGGFENVEFRLGDIEDLPVENDSVDVVLSNCVINLAPDKRRVFAEIYRVLKVGGRFSISDIVTQGQVPEDIRQDMEKWAECMGGALDKDEYLQIIRDSGFDDLRITQAVEYEYDHGSDHRFISLSVEGFKRE